MLKKYGFFVLLYFIAMLVKAETYEEEMNLTPSDFTKEECALIENGEINHGSCLVNSFYFKNGMYRVVKFNGTAYALSSYDCNDDYCNINSLASDEDKEFSDGEAKSFYRDKNFKIVKDPFAKYQCLKRKKHTKPVYELCFQNVSSAFNNYLIDSYGTWSGKEQSGENYKLIINKHGFEQYDQTNLKEKCHEKLYARQKIVTYSGKKIIKDINKSIKSYTDIDDFKTVKDSWQKLKKSIKKDQQYKVLHAESDCAEGYQKVVFLSPKEGFYIFVGPED